MTEEQTKEIEEIKRLCDKSSFKADDLVSLRNLYVKYIDSKANICLSCPSNLRHHIKIFQQNKDNMIKKVENNG